MTAGWPLVMRSLDHCMKKRGIAREPKLIWLMRIASWQECSRPMATLFSALPVGLASSAPSLVKTKKPSTFMNRRSGRGAAVPWLPFSDLGALLNNVALICRKAGRATAAEPYYLRALEIYETQLGPEHPDVASVLNNLGVFYTNEKRFTEAEQVHLRALAI